MTATTVKPRDYRAYAIDLDNIDDFYQGDLPPSVLDIKEYWEELLSEGKFFGIDWATNEIKNHLLSWCRVGIVAQQVRKFCKWKDLKLSSFKEYCEKVLGVSHGWIIQIIKATKTCLELAKNGFTDLPKNPSQAMHLTKFEGNELCEKWQSILDTVPKHSISAKKIEEHLYPEKPQMKSVKLPETVYNRLQQKALEQGISVKEAIDQAIGAYLGDEESETNETHPEDPETEEKSEKEPSKLERWENDLQSLVAEHDAQLSEAKSTNEPGTEPS